MELSTKIYLLNDNGEKFMGIGVLWLLEAIEECSSLRQAAAKMGLSYSKAYTMLSNLEKELGKPIVDRHKGGHVREGVQLTPFAKEFISLYRSFQDEVKSSSQILYEKFLQEYRKMEVQE